MNFKPVSTARYLSIILALCLIGCGRIKSQGNTEILEQKIDADVLEQVYKFATNEAEPAQEAWNKLSSYSQKDLLASLQRLQKTEGKDELFKVYCAFVLCNLRYEYDTNKQIITTTFNSSLSYADRLQGIIARLIDKGDAELLPSLFAIVTRSDGSLSEGLGDTFATQMQKMPEQFLLKLNPQSKIVRQRVYELMNLGMSEEEKVKIKNNLLSVIKKSPTSQPAKEMLDAISK